MAAIDLTTVESVRQFMQYREADTEQDDIIAAEITRASRVIMRDCEREFRTTAPAGTAREFEYPGNGFLDLSPYDLRTLTLLELDPDGTTVTLAADQYRLYPRPNPEGVFTALRLTACAGPASRFSAFGSRLVRVTGTWGWPSVPEEAETACIITVATWLRRDVSAFSTVFNVDEGRLERPEALPSAARALLSPLRRAVPY